MAPTNPSNTPEIDALLARAAQGDRESLGRLLERDRDRLRRMVAVRLDRRLQGRVDPSDVIQEAQLEAAERLPEYVRNPTMPLFLWLRLITAQRLLTVHRRHLGARLRSVQLEVSIHHGPWPQATSAALAAQLLGRLSTPSAAAVRAEIKDRLREALDSMEPGDRDVLVLRHFEQLSTTEAALELGISVEAAKKRHVRALRRLKDILSNLPGGEGGFA